MMKQFISAAKKIAVVVLVVATISFSGLMTVEAYRAKFIEVITEVFYDLTHFTFFSSWSGDVGLGEIEFSYLPVGMTEVRRETFDNPKSQIIYLENIEGRQIKVSQQVVTDDADLDIILDTEDANTATISFGDSEAFLIVKEDTSTLMWEDEPYLILLTGDFPSEEMIEIANGMSITK